MSAAKKNMPPADKIELYDAAIALLSEVERKGATTPYTSKNGHMFSFLDKEGVMGLRLAADDRDAFMAEHGTALMEQHGRVMKEFVVIPYGILENTEVLKGYLEKSVAYTASLKPKPSKKK